MEKVLVTGGAGFIGSYLVDALMSSGISSIVFDNFASGVLENVQQWLENPNFTLIRGDLLNPSDLLELKRDYYDTVFHLAANPEVKVGDTNPDMFFQQNLVATKNLLDFLRRTEDTATLVFTSSSTVYGDATEIPTSENYSPMYPVSFYGATKLASEALISAYAHTYGFKTIVFRLANVIGPRSSHGVIHDFIQKLKKDHTRLEILGDGTQTKSYLYISDCIDAMLLALERSKRKMETYNVGSEDQINVKVIAQIVIKEMGLKNLKLTFTGGVDGGRGWKGDVKKMLLDISKLKSLGWQPKLNSKQAVERTARALVRRHC